MTIYRARDGIFLGVCKGLARSKGLPVILVRLAVIVLASFTGFLPGIGLYFLAAVIMDPEPVLAPANAEEADFYDRYNGSKTVVLREMQKKMSDLDKKIGRIEDRVVTGRGDPSTWEERLYSGRN